MALYTYIHPLLLTMMTSSISPMATEQDEKVQDAALDEQPQDKDDCSLSEIIIKGILISVVIAGAVVLVVWLSLRPGITVYVESASLASFDLSSAGTLRHNLSVELSMRNPTRSDSAYYRRVETSAYYDGSWFQWAPLDDFYIGPKKTVVLRAAMAGEAPLHLGASGVELYGRQRKAGAFDLEVRLQLKVRYRVWSSKSSKSRTRKDRYKCFLPGLRLRAAGGFVGTKCKSY